MLGSFYKFPRQHSWNFGFQISHICCLVCQFFVHYLRKLLLFNCFSSRKLILLYGKMDISVLKYLHSYTGCSFQSHKSNRIPLR